jgi:hypothetical protein
MKNKSEYIIAIVLLLFVSISCTDVLEKKAVDSFNQESVFSDMALTKAYIANCYKLIGGGSVNVLGLNRRQLGNATDQLLSMNGAASMVFTKGNMSPDQMGHFSDGNAWINQTRWDRLYTNIKNINVFLANVGNVPIKISTDQVNLDIMKGEAYFIRAFEYTQLLRCFGGAVLVDKPFELGTDYLTQTRASIKETRDFILADLDKAITLLPNKSSVEQGRASQGAAAALKARLLIFCASTLTNGGYEPTNSLVSFTDGTQAQRWQAARDAAKLVIDGTYGTYSLTGTTSDPPSPMTDAVIKSYSDNFFSIFNQKGAWNNEVIWGIQFNDQPTAGHKLNQEQGPNGWHSWGNCSPTEDAVRKFEMADGTPFRWDAYTPGDQYLRTATAAQLAADPKLNPYNGREPRFYATILYHGAYWQPRPTDMAALDPTGTVQTGNFYNNDGTLLKYGLDTRQTLVENWNGTKTGYYLKKFMDPAIEGQYYYNSNALIEFRYAEVLLNYAEACIESGGADLQTGLNALNMVRNRAGLPDRVTSDQATARNWVRNERNIEFFAELEHWYDIRRWMTVSTVLTNLRAMNIKQFTNGNMEWKLDNTTVVDSRIWNPINIWLPIIRTEMNKAPQLQQNPGYL